MKITEKLLITTVFTVVWFILLFVNQFVFFIYWFVVGIVYTYYIGMKVKPVSDRGRIFILVYAFICWPVISLVMLVDHLFMEVEKV